MNKYAIQFRTLNEFISLQRLAFKYGRPWMETIQDSFSHKVVTWFYDERKVLPPNHIKYLIFTDTYICLGCDNSQNTCSPSIQCLQDTPIINYSHLIQFLGGCLEEEIIIGDLTITFRDNCMKVGDQEIPKDTILKIAEKFKQ